MKPGEIINCKGADFINADENLETILIKVTNMGDRPIRIGKPYAFFEVNQALEFDRDKAKGYRLNVPAGTMPVLNQRFQRGRVGCTCRNKRSIWTK